MSFCFVIIEEDKLNAEIGRRIKQLRIKAHYSSYENFAIEYELDRKYYWSVEKGRNITIQYLYRILIIHKISFEDFFKFL